MCAAACHSGGGNVIEAGKTLQKDAISQYLDGGLSVSAILLPATERCFHMTGICPAALPCCCHCDTDSAQHAVNTLTATAWLWCVQEAAIIKQVQNGKNAMPAWSVSHMAFSTCIQYLRL